MGDMNKVEALDFVQIQKSEKEGKSFLNEGNLEIIKKVKVKLEVRVGEAQLTIDDLYNLSEGSVVPLTRSAMEPVDMLIDGKVVARGHLVAADDNFGIQITELNV
jgi:flagellar motor switch protein FliN/FliY